MEVVALHGNQLRLVGQPWLAACLVTQLHRDTAIPIHLGIAVAAFKL